MGFSAFVPSHQDTIGREVLLAPRYRVDSGDFSLALRMSVFPAARHGAAFIAIPMIGALNAVM